MVILQILKEDVIRHRVGGELPLLHGKEVYRSVEVTDNVQTSTLSLADQVRLIAASMSNDDVAELERNEKVATDRLKKIAAFKSFLDGALQAMNDMGENSVTMQVSHEFKPYFNEVLLDPHSYAKYYDILIEKKDLPMNVKHYIIVKLKKKGD